MSENQEAIQIPHLKADALIDIKIGTQFIQRLQNTIGFLAEGKVDELNELEKKGGDYSNLSPWENAIVTTTMLLKELVNIAEANGIVEYKPLEETLAEIVTKAV